MPVLALHEIVLPSIYAYTTLICVRLLLVSLIVQVRRILFFFSSRRRHTRLVSDWSSDVCSSDLHGPSKVVLEMSAALAAQGHIVDIVTTSLAHRGSWLSWPSSGDLLPVESGRRMLRDGYHITFCRPTWPTRWGASYEMGTVLRDLIPRSDIVHVHSLYLFHTLLASRLARALKVPYVVRPHGTLD